MYICVCGGVRASPWLCVILRVRLLHCTFYFFGQCEGLNPWKCRQYRLARFFLQFKFLMLESGGSIRQVIQMKKLFFILSLLLVGLPAVAQDGETIMVDGLRYQFNELKNWYEVVYDDEYQTYESVTIPAHIPGQVAIGASAFENCENLKELVIEEGVTYIGSSAFWGCRLERITIPSTMEAIGEDAFAAVIGSTYGTMYPQELNVRDLDAWCNIVFSNEYSNPGGAMVVNGETLTELSLPFATEIKDFAFRGIWPLTEIDLPNVMYVGEQSFMCCCIRDVSLPSVVSIGARAFEDCYELETVNLSGNLNSLSFGAFSGCTNLKAINIPEDGSRFFSYDGVVYENVYGMYSTLLCVPGAKETIEFPVTPPRDIEAMAFKGCKIKNLEIPNGVVNIYDQAFYTSSLKYVVIPQSVKYIGSQAFGYVPLETVVMMDGDAISMVESAFYSPNNPYCNIETLYVGRKGCQFMNRCTNLRRLYLSGLGEWSENRASGESEVLGGVYLAGTIPATYEYCFKDTAYKSARLFVDESLYDDVRDAEVWKNFSLIYPWTPKQDCVEPDVFGDGGYIYNLISAQYGLCELSGAEAVSAQADGEVAAIPASASGYKVVGIVASKLPGGSAAVLSIPQSVEYIDGDAFVNYKELECIECEAAVPPVIIGSPFNTQTYANVRLQVPAGSLEAYRAAPVWNKFKNMVEEGVLGAVPVESAAVSVSVLDGDIVVSGKADGSVVTVLDLSGRCVAKGTAGRVSGLGAGVYIVAVDGAVPVKVTL